MLAQLPSTTGGEFGAWMLGLAGFMFVLLMARQLWVSFFPPKSEAETKLEREVIDLEKRLADEARPKRPEDEFATKKELTDGMMAVKADIREKLGDVKDQLQGEMRQFQNQVLDRMNDAKEQHRELKDYVHKTAHENKDGQQAILMRLTAMGAAMGCEVVKRSIKKNNEEADGA